MIHMQFRKYFIFYMGLWIQSTKQNSFLLRSFYFDFMNEHNLIQASLCYILQTVSIKVYSVIPFSRNPHNTETGQLIWNANKLTNLYTIQISNKRYFRTGYNNPSINHPLYQYDNNSNNKKKNGNSHLTPILSFFIASY